MLTADFKLPCISTGDEIRKLRSTQNTDQNSQKIAQMLKQGNLIDDDLVFKILQKRLLKEDCQKGFILDGFPRNVKQAQILEKSQINVNLVINIKLPDEFIITKLLGRRICKSCGHNYNINAIKTDKYDMPAMNPKVSGKCDLCGGDLIIRGDDNYATIKQRFQVYEKQTDPLIDFYQQKLIHFEPFQGIASYPILKKNIEDYLSSKHQSSSSNPDL